MDWNRYKAICDQPDVCSRWLLAQTLELLEDEALAARLREALDGPPLPKPGDHAGADETDMLRPSLSLVEVRAVRCRVEQAVARGATTGGTRTRGLGGFAQAWLEYETYLQSLSSARQRQTRGPACSIKS